MNKRDSDCFPGLKDGEAESLDIWAEGKKLDVSILRKFPLMAYFITKHKNILFEKTG